MTNENRKTYTAAIDIPPYSLVKFGADDVTVTLATSATDNIIGVSSDIYVHAGNLIDINHLGVARVKFGGSVERGASFTSDSNGNAVATAEGNVKCGYALSSASAGDIALAVIGRFS